ncbi:MAG: hypothetical protein IKK92_02035 [Prevotella sp.]|nr:hypothetical protein [Prevotella sp.]
MINTKFEAYKLRRELKKVGVEYEFKRVGLNKFREPAGDPTVVCKLTGLYHDYNTSGSGAIVLNSTEAVQIRSKKIPMILCLYEDAKTLKLDDFVEINSKKHKVIGVVNIQEWSIVADISLEVVDDGIHN